MLGGFSWVCSFSFGRVGVWGMVGVVEGGKVLPVFWSVTSYPLLMGCGRLDASVVCDVFDESFEGFEGFVFGSGGGFFLWGDGHLLGGVGFGG